MSNPFSLRENFHVARGQTVCFSRQMETRARSEKYIKPVLASRHFKAILVLDNLPVFYYNNFGFKQNFLDEKACKACHTVILHL